MKNMRIVIVSIIFTNVRTIFHYGRVKPGSFEYPKLNGWMSVKQAVYKCENDLACGGFTFKGSFRTKQNPMEMYFFHVVKLPDELRLKTLQTLDQFLSKCRYLLKKFHYLIDMTENSHHKTNQYLYWSTYKVDRDYVRISHLKVKEGLELNSKEMKNKYVFQISLIYRVSKIKVS